MNQHHAKIKGCRRLDARGHVTVLQVTQGYPGKTYVGPECAKPLGKSGFTTGKFFVPKTVWFRDGAQLAAIVRKAMLAADCVLVRGNLLTKAKSVRRLKEDQEDGTLATLGKNPNAFLMIDLDHIPNLDQIDPRTSPEAAWAYLLSLLPKSLARAQFGYQWSSSMCVGSASAPGELNAHLYVALDEGLNEAAAKLFLQDLSAYVSARLRLRGHLVAAKYVDKKMSEVHQAYYVARPRFLQGAPDPFPGTRAFRIHDGGEPALDVAAVGSEALDWLETLPKVAPTSKAKKQRVEPISKAKPPVGAARVYSLEAIRAARDAVACREDDRIADFAGRRPLKEAGFVARAITGIYDLTYGRVASGSENPRWAAWHREGGFPDGQRDTLTNCLASLVVESLPLTMARGEVSAYVLALLRTLVCPEWLAAEWVDSGYQRSVLDRYERAAAGEKDVHGRDARYHYRRNGISATFEPQEDEIAEYGLNFGAPNAIRAVGRTRKGMTKRAGLDVAAATHDHKIAALVARGRSVREVAAELGLSRGKVIRALAHREMPGLIAAAETIVVALPVRAPCPAPMAVAVPATVVPLPIRARSLTPQVTATNANPERISLTG